MKGCFHSTDEGQQLVQKMNTEFGLSIESAAYIADVSGTSIDCRPFTDIPSKLFRDLIAMYGDSEQAAKIKSICYSPEFLEKFGDWVTDVFCGATNSDGEPEIVWTHKSKGDTFIKFENSIGMAIANAIDDKIALDRDNYKTYKDVVTKLRVYTVLKDKFDSGQKLDQEEIYRITNKKSTTKEEVRLALLRGILSSYKALRPFIQGINLTPAFISFDQVKHYNGATASYVVKNWDDVIKLDNGVIPVLSLFPNFLSTSVSLKLDRKTPVFTMEGKNFKINPNIEFNTVDNYFSNTQVGQNKTNVQIDAWNAFKAENTDFIERLLNRKSDLIHFLEAFQSYKQSAIKSIYNKGRQVNEEAFDFAKRSVILSDDPIFGIAKFAIITNPALPNKSEYLKQLEDELYSDGQKDQWEIPSVAKYTDVPAHQERFANLFGNANQLNSRDVLQKLIDENSPLANVAKILLKQGADITINVQDDLVPISDGTKRAGVYDPVSNTITVSRQTYLYPDSLLLHEIMHAHTYRLINSDKYNEKANKLFKEAQKLIFKKYGVSSYEEMLEKYGARKTYGLENVNEFFSELWTNSEFIKELNSVGTQKATIWKKLKNFLLEILGIKNTSKVFKDASILLDEMISETGDSYFYRKELESDPDFISQLEGLPSDFFVPAELASRPLEGNTFYGDIESVKDYFGLINGKPNQINTQEEDLNTLYTQAVITAEGFIGEISQSPYKKVGSKFVIKNSTEIGTDTYAALEIIMNRGHLPEMSIYGTPYDGQVKYNIGYDSGKPAIMAISNRDLFDEGWMPPIILLDRDELRKNKALDGQTIINIESVAKNPDFSKFILINDSDKPLLDFLKKIGANFEILSQKLQVNTLPLSNWTLHSGGAEGSDVTWARIGQEFGVTPKHYYHGRRTPYGNVEITEEEFEQGKRKVHQANNYLGRGNITSYMDLLARNYVQVKNSDQIVAIGVISRGLEKEDGKIWNAAVDGGTGWAVEMAIEENKPVYVFDQNRNQWYRNVDWSEQAGYRYFEPCDVPVLSQNFAGIGTREINAAGQQAIRDCFVHTVIENSTNIADNREFLDKDGLRNSSSIYIFDEVKDIEGEKIPAHFGDIVTLHKEFKPIYLIDVTTGNQYKYDDLLDYFANTKITLIENNAGIKSLNTEEAHKYLHNLLAKSSLILNAWQSVQTYEELHQQPVQTDLFGNVQELAETSTANTAIHPISFNKEQKIAINGAVKAYQAKGRNQDIVTIIGKAGTGKTTIIGEILRLVSSGLYGKRLNVVCGAVSNKAKQNLYSKIAAQCNGCPITLEARSIAGMLGKKPDQSGEVKDFVQDPIARQNAEKIMGRADVVIVDEVSMVGETALTDIERIAPHALIIYLGDIRQVKPIDSKADVAPGFVRGNKTFELLERVRQGEGSAVLDYADVFGNISAKNPSEITEEDVASFSQALKQQPTSVLETNAMYTINGQVNNVVQQIYPLIKKALEKDNPSYFHIVPYHREARREYNDLIRTLVINEKLQDKYSFNPNDPNYIGTLPYQPGEWIVLNDAFVSDSAIIDNGTELKVKNASLLNNDNLTHVEGEDQNHVYWDAQIKIWELNCEYLDVDGKVRNTTLLVPEYTPQNLRAFETKLNILAAQAKQNKVLWKQFYAFKELFADVSAPWALNVHKAQGQTYEVAYVPVDDFIKSYNEKLHFNNGDKNRSIIDACSELYTAITRSANITIIGSVGYTGATQDDLVQKNEDIKAARKEQTEKTIAEQVIEDAGGKIIDDTTPIVVPKQLKWVHDFLKFVTGNETVFKNLKSPENQQYLMELRSKLFQRETELEHFGHTFGPIIETENGDIDFATILKDPAVLDRPITADVAELYPTISNLEVRPAQVIIPKLHKDAFKLGSHTLAEIDLNFFKTKNSFYRSNVDGTDFLIRTHAGRLNIVLSKNLEVSTNARFGKPIKVTTDSDGYRLDANENRMYLIPENAVIYKDSKGNETLVIMNPLKSELDYTEAEDTLQKVIDTISNIVSVQPFLTHFNDITGIRNMLQLSSDASVVNVIGKDLYELGKLDNIQQIKQGLDELYKSPKTQRRYESVLANALYNSFVKALKITSSRIPTQALASFMDMLVAAYNPSGANDVFVSMWLLWLQGSDLDIDKAYMMGYGVNNLGMFYHWSKLADYTNAKRAQLSDELPVPNGKKVVLSTNARAYSGNVNSLIFIDGNNHNPELTALINKYYLAGADKTNRLAAIVDMLKYLDRHKSFSVTQDVILNPYFKHLINLLNKHNLGTVSEEAAKNLAASRIQRVCSDVRNIQSAHTPIDRATSKLTSELNKMPGREGGSAYDGKSIYQLQEDNLTGKAVVGVMANALKAFLSMSQYFNLYYRNTDRITPDNAPFFFNRFTLNGKTYNLANLANIVMSDEQANQIATFAMNLSGLNEEILHTKDDVSIILSAFTTLATDNAKMLALAKLRASLNLASMHCYLAMFGVPFKDIVEYTTSPLFTDLYDLTKANGYTGSDGKVNDEVWTTLRENARAGRGYTGEEVEQLHRLYNLAQELRQFTSLLGINQGMKSGIEESIAFKHVFKNLYNEQINKLPGQSREKKIDNQKDLVMAICKLHGCLPTQELIDYYNRKINTVLDFLQKYNLSLYDLKIDMDKYFTDPVYRQGIVDCYDIVKGTINIFDIINKLPHFYEMLRAFNTTLLRVLAGAKSRFVLSQSEEYFHPERISNRDDNGNRLYRLDYNLSDYVIKRLQRFYDDYVISDFILEKIAPILNISYTKNPTRESIIKYTVDLTNKDGLKLFKQLVFDIIAKLKAMNPDDELLKQLTPVNINRNSDLEPDYRYQLNFNLDSLSQKASEADTLKYNQVVGGFNKLKNISINTLLDNYQNESNYPLTVGDILFLYNTIFNLDAAGQNSLSLLFGRYIADSGENGIPTMKYLIEQEYDQRKRELVPDEKLLNYYIFRPRIPARLNGVMEYLSERIQNNSPLINLQTVQDTKHVLEAFERFTEALRQNVLTINLGEC